MPRSFIARVRRFANSSSIGSSETRPFRSRPTTTGRSEIPATKKEQSGARGESRHFSRRFVCGRGGVRILQRSLNSETCVFQCVPFGFNAKSNGTFPHHSLIYF